MPRPWLIAANAIRRATLLSRLNNREKFAGAVTAGWTAYNISSDKGTGIGGWSDQQVFDYLAAGHASGRGTAAGPMGEAVDQSFSRMEPADIHAVVAYLRTIPPIASPDLPAVDRAPGAGIAQEWRWNSGCRRQARI